MQWTSSDGANATLTDLYWPLLGIIDWPLLGIIYLTVCFTSSYHWNNSGGDFCQQFIFKSHIKKKKKLSTCPPPLEVSKASFRHHEDDIPTNDAHSSQG